MPRLGFWLTVLVVALLAQAPADASAAGQTKIYKWVDDNGIAHYTADPETIPRNLRDRLRSLTDEPRTSPPPPSPAALPAPPEVDDESWAVRDAPAQPPAPASEPPAPSDGTELARSAPPPPSPARADLDRRIRELEARIARDEQALETMLDRQAPASAVELAEEPAFREIARRLPGLQADLRALRAQRAQEAGP